jgi:hypothetical protein
MPQALSGSVPSTYGVQTPTVDAAQLSQPPSHWRSQHTPSAQTPLAHWRSRSHVVPIGPVATHSVPVQYSAVEHSSSTTQVAQDASSRQMPVGQVVDTSRHSPASSHAGSVRTPAAQRDAPQLAPGAASDHMRPAASGSQTLQGSEGSAAPSATQSPRMRQLPASSTWSHTSLPSSQESVVQE